MFTRLLIGLDGSPQADAAPAGLPRPLSILLAEDNLINQKLAVKLLEQSLEATKNPYYAGSFDYGPDQPHCYTGEPTLPALPRRLQVGAAQSRQVSPQ